jgi:ABC-type multidrug transport system fused ATPase/permease subunit
MTAKLRASFKRRVGKGEKYPLLWALHETYFFEFWLGGFCNLMSAVMQFMSPFTLRYLIQFATDAYIAAQQGLPTPHIGAGIGLVFGITVMQILQSLGTNHFIYRGMMIGGMARATLISLIYEKSMVISGRAKAGGALLPNIPETTATSATKKDDKKKKKNKPKKAKKGPPGPGGPGGLASDGVGWGNGRIVNLMSVDTYRVDQACGLFHIIWTAPLACVGTLVLLLINLTYSALAGFALLVIGMPLLTRAIKSLIMRRKGINKITDQRVSLTQEILQAVRFVKFFGWESSFLQRLQDFRNKEIAAIQVLMSIRNGIMAISLSLPIFASMLSFITYSLSNHDLAPAQVFSSLALFNGLRMPLNLLPLVIGQVTDAWSSLGRIQEFLLLEEREDEAVLDPDLKSAVEMHDASFTWERTPTQESEGTIGGRGPSDKKPKQGKGDKEDASKPGKPPGSSEGSSAGGGSTIVEEREPFKLHGMDFEIGRNELVAVIGTVGSGKSSLLAALAGDMRKTSGEVLLGASRAFCPQYAWIQNTTVRDNILFGKDMDKDWYKEVIKAYVILQHPPSSPSK